MSLAEYNEGTMGVPEFYKGRSVLVSGFTGTLGKLLVEKLLYSCPDINKIYVIIRCKRGKTMEQRVEDTLKSKAFDRLHEKYPGVAHSKIIPLSGDMVEERLGLSHKDEELIRNEVSVIFHGAASVRFDDPLDESIKMNIIPVKSMIDLALTMKKLLCFMYISTAYTNCDHINIKEELYPAKAKWTELIDLYNKMDKTELRLLSSKYIKPMPNTYTFSKSIAEHMINDYRDRLPVIISRPSIVLSGSKEPFPGWVDNFYGPFGLVAAAFTGLLRVLFLNDKKKCNYIPSDIVINSFIIGAWKTSLKYMSIGNDNSLAIYNAASPQGYNWTQKEFFGLAFKGFQVRGLIDDGLNAVCIISTANELWFYIMIFLRNFLPAVALDSLLVLMGKQPALTKLRRKLLNVQLSLRYFTFVTFDIDINNFETLNSDLRPEDRDAFGWDFNLQSFKYLYQVTYPCYKLVLLKPVYDDLKTFSKRIRMLYWIDKSILYTASSVLCWIAYKLCIWPIIKVVQNFTLF